MAVHPYEESQRIVKEVPVLEAAFEVLHELLEAGVAVWTGGAIYNVRQQGGREKGLQFHIYANDHVPHHFHVKGADRRTQDYTDDYQCMECGPDE
ncbi:MAG: hypothetical protein WBW32_01385 [Luteibacter sp.]